jgi:hypothetical protein
MQETPLEITHRMANTLTDAEFTAFVACHPEWFGDWSESAAAKLPSNVIPFKGRATR